MEVVSLIAVSWSAGINAYLTVMLLGIGGRTGWVDAPDSLQSPMVLGVAGSMFLIEFVVDKIPLADNLWDALHTVIRPAVAAMVGTAVAGAELGEIWAAVFSASLALIGHLSKATTRLAVNVSPEPLSNIALSLTEDLLVTGLMALVMAYPYLAAAIGAAAVLLSAVLAYLMWRLAHRGWKVVKQRLPTNGRFAAADEP